MTLDRPTASSAMPSQLPDEGRGHRRGKGRRRVRAALLVIGALGVATVAAPSGAAPGDRSSGEHVSTAANTLAAAPASTRHDLDPGGGFPAAPPGTLAGGIAAAAQGVVDQRAKQFISTSAGAPIYFLAYSGIPNTPPSAPTSFQQVYLPDPFYQPACAVASSNPADKLQSLYSQYYLYAAWPPKGGAVPGAFPPIQVKTAAFGAIPVTATLQLRQRVVNGKLQPLLDETWAPNNPRDGGGAPCDKSFAAPVSSLVSGQVDISVTDLTVDGVPVDVGSSCRTVKPVDVALWGGNDYFPGTGGPLGQYDGIHPGSLGKLDSPYYMARNGTTIPPATGLDIPAFTNCRGGSDDISRLVTAMASGPNNPVSAYQSPVAFYVVDLNNLTRCATLGKVLCPVPAQNPPAIPPH